MSFLHHLIGRPFRTTRRPSAQTPEGRLREMLDAASTVVVLIGSGLPDARDAKAAPAPIRYRHFLIDAEARLEQWRRSLADAATYAAASPDRGHEALASLSRLRRLKVVTLRPDGLLGRAGVHPGDHVELNGNAGFAACTQCGKRTPIAVHAGTVATGDSPVCDLDGAPLKPTAGLFGEVPLRSRLNQAEEWSGACGLFVAADASLSSGPEARLLDCARACGAKVALVGATRAEPGIEADLVVDGDASGILAALAG